MMNKTARHRITAVTLAAAMLVSAAACSENNEKADKTETTVVTEETSVTGMDLTFRNISADSDSVGKYTGDVKNGKPEGTGRFESDTETYDGEWSGGKPDGSGTLVIKKEKNGETVTYTYRGTFVDGELEGRFTKSWEYENGLRSSMTATISKGALSGNIELDLEQNDDEKGKTAIEFKGSYEGGSGELKLTFQNGDEELYTGEFLRFSEFSGIPEIASGTMSRSEGGFSYEYDGEFKKNRKSGAGKEVIKNENGEMTVREGDFFEDDIFNGSVVVYDAEGNIAAKYTYKEGEQIFNWRDNELLTGLHDLISGVLGLFNIHIDAEAETDVFKAEATTDVNTGDLFDVIWNSVFDDIVNAF